MINISIYNISYIIKYTIYYKDFSLNFNRRSTVQKSF